MRWEDVVKNDVEQLADDSNWRNLELNREKSKLVSCLWDGMVLMTECKLKKNKKKISKKYGIKTVRKAKKGVHNTQKRGDSVLIRCRVEQFESNLLWAQRRSETIWRVGVQRVSLWVGLRSDQNISRLTWLQKNITIDIFPTRYELNATRLVSSFETVINSAGLAHRRAWPPGSEKTKSEGRKKIYKINRQHYGDRTITSGRSAETAPEHRKRSTRVRKPNRCARARRT